MFENDESGLMTDEGTRVEDFNNVYESAPGKPESAEYVMTTWDKLKTKWALRDRQKSKVLWAAIIGCIMTVFSVFGLWEKIGITAEGFKELAGAIGAVLAAFGIINDPTNKEGF